MKILEVISIGYPAGGAETSVILLDGELRRRGHEVKIFSSNLEGDGMFSDYQFKSIPSNSPLKIFHHLFYFHSYFTMRKIIRDFRPDVIHFHTTSSFSPSVFFAIGKIPAVMTIHGPENFTSRILSWFMSPGDYKNASFHPDDLTPKGKLRYHYYRSLQRPIYSLALKRIKFFIAPSKYLANVIRDDVPSSKIRQIYNGINLPSAKPLPNNKRVLYVGRLEKVKGVDYLIRAFGAVVHDIPGAELHIIGDGPHRKELEKLSADLNLVRHVIFRGWVGKKQDVISEYENTSILAIPSIWPENLPTVCIEALAVGRPIVGTDTGGIPELVRDGESGYIVPTKDLPSLSRALVKLLSGRESLVRMGKFAAESSEQFNILKFTDQIESLYKEILYANSHR